MPFRFYREATLGENIQRVLQEEIHKAYNHLTETLPPHKGIHEARKGHKKIRAILRLIRFTVGTTAYREANTYYRDTARTLSSIRDATALIEAIDDLKSLAPLQLKDELYQLLKDKLVARRDILAQDALPEEELRQKAAKRLVSYQRQTLTLPINGNKFKLIKEGLEKIYSQGWEGLKLVRTDPNMEHIHDWRKRIKYHWYQLQLISPAWPVLLKPRADELKQLSDWLGTWRDIGLLQEAIEAESELMPDLTSYLAFTEIAESVKTRLLTASLQLGGNLYFDKPGNFTSRTETFWKNWKFNILRNYTNSTKKSPAIIPKTHLTDYFAEVTDPRNTIHITYPFPEFILLITFCLLLNKRTPYEIHQFLREHDDLVKPHFPTFDRFPSASTFRRMISRIDFREVHESFQQWMQHSHPKLSKLIHRQNNLPHMPELPVDYVSYATALQPNSLDIGTSSPQQAISTMAVWLNTTRTTESHGR